MKRLFKIAAITLTITITFFGVLFAYKYFRGDYVVESNFQLVTYSQSDISSDEYNNFINSKNEKLHVNIVSNDYNDDTVSVKGIESIDSNINEFYNVIDEVSQDMPSDLYEYYNLINIYLVKDLTIKSLTGEGIAVGYTVRNRSNKTVDMFIDYSHFNKNFGTSLRLTVYHEFLHVLYPMLDINEDKINSLNPSGFEYGNHSDEEHNEYKDYFYNSYSMYSMEEDLAETFAFNMTNSSVYTGYQAKEKWNTLKVSLLQLEDEEFKKLIRFK